MRSLFVAAAFAAIALPAVAQDLDPATIGPTVERDFWCATAMGLVAYNAGQAGDTAGAEQANANMTLLFTVLVKTMQQGGYTREQYDALTKQFTATVMDPFRTDDTTFTRAECDTAVAEATAATAPAAPEPVAPAQ